MPPVLDIRVEDNGTKGRYLTELEGETAALDYLREGDDRRIAVHVGVPREIGGRGVGQALVARMVEDARNQGFRIIPVCRFVKAHRRRHPEWADAFAV